MSNTWFSSDTHYFHTNVIKYSGRPFADAKEMNEALIRNHNERVQPDDDWYFLGDFSFGREAGPTKAIFDRLNGKKHLVAGNHDDEKPYIFGMGWNRVLPPLYETNIQGRTVVMCHFPLHSWHWIASGTFHLHGHCHGTLPFDPKLRRLDVGVDCWDMAPVSWEQIKEKLGAVEVIKDHRTRDTEAK